MIAFRVEQAVYTRLEGAYSPTGQSGYQLAFKPRGIGGQSARRLEELLPGFRSRDPEESRLQFATLDEEWFMLSYTTVPGVDAASAGIADRSGRASLAHAILVRREELSKVEFNPFRIIDAVPWITNFRVLLEHFRHLDGEAPPTIIRAQDPPDGPAEEPSPAELRDILYLVRAARDLTSRRETVDIEASPADAADWLRLAFHYAQPEQAAFCTFTTSFDAHDQPRGRFWAIARRQVGHGTRIRYYPAEKRLIATNDFGSA